MTKLNMLKKVIVEGKRIREAKRTGILKMGQGRKSTKEMREGG